MENKFAVIKNPKIFDKQRRLRFPLLGTIRLGIKEKSIKTGEEHPKDVSYFVVPDEIKRARRPKELGGEPYGEQPKELDVMFPCDDESMVFPQALKWYSMSSGLLCRGNGVEAERWNKDSLKWEARECSEECSVYLAGDCKLRATLFIIVYTVNMGGVYRIISSSGTSIGDVFSGFAFQTLKTKRFSRIPLVLRRERMDTAYVNDKLKKKVKSIHYPLKLISMLSLEQEAQYRNNIELMSGKEPEKVLLPILDPDADNPLKDEGAVVIPVSEFTDEEHILEAEQPNDAKEAPALPTPSPEKPAPQLAPEQPAKVEPKAPANEADVTTEAHPVKITDKEISDRQRRKMMAICTTIKMGDKERHELTQFLFSRKSSSELEVNEKGYLIHILEGLQSGLYQLKRNDAKAIIKIWDTKINKEVKF